MAKQEENHKQEQEVDPSRPTTAACRARTVSPAMEMVVTAVVETTEMMMRTRGRIGILGSPRMETPDGIGTTT